MTRSSIDRPSHSIHVELGARSYAIVIRRDLLREIGEELKRLKCVGNIIVGNGLDGVTIQNGAAENIIYGNAIGVNTANARLGNGRHGVAVYSTGSDLNLIGGSAAFQGNIIAANSQDGVRLAEAAARNKVQGNRIGMDASGTTALGNGQSGVVVDAANTNTIGGPGAMP